MGAACCNHRTHRKSNLRQHLTSSSTAQIYGNEIKEQNRQKKHPKDNNQKDNNRKYSMLEETLDTVDKVQLLIIKKQVTFPLLT